MSTITFTHEAMSDASRLRWHAVALVLLLLALASLPAEALAHGVTAGDKGYIQEVSGVLLLPFAYLGAKHMVTGYDHLLFLLGVQDYHIRGVHGRIPHSSRHSPSTSIRVGGWLV